MNGRKKGKKRFASACMAFLMAVSGLPLSETVYAAESAPADVSISWTASRGEDSHAGTVTLQAENRTEEDVIVGIRLDPEEEKALASPLPNGVELLTYEQLKSSAKPSPSPTPSADPSPSPSQSPSVSPAPSTEPTAGASSTPEATGDPGETEEPEGTEEPESTKEPAPSQTPESTKTPTEPTPEESIAPQPAESAQPSSAPEAEASAEPAQIPESTPPAAAEEPTGNLISDEIVSQEPVIIQNLSAFTETQGADESGAEAVWLPLANTAETGPSAKAPEEGIDEKYIAFTLKANGSVNYSFDFKTIESYQKIAIEGTDVYVFPMGIRSDLKAQPLVLGKPAEWRIELTAEETTNVPIADGKAVVPDMTFRLAATPKKGFTKAQTVMFNLTLPEGLSLPEGQLRVENGEILAGNAVVAVLSDLPADAQVELPDNPNGVSFTVTRTDEMDQALDEMTLELTVKGRALVCDEALYNNTATPVVSLTAQATNDGEPSKPLTAQTKLNIVPEEPSVGVSDTEELTKNIYWCDNNGEGGKRPANADIHPTLYFTIDGGEKVKLDLSTMAQVGLTEMPGFDWNGNSFTVEVPTEISIDNGYGQVTTKAVQWEMEAPQFEGYEFVEINADNKDEYPAAGDKFGWYYLLTDDFSFTINLRMGDAQAPTSAQVCDLLKNFEFHWQYGSTNQTVSFAKLEQDVHFSYDPDTGTVSVPGIWKYNVDGSPISFWIDENSEFSESMSIPSADAADLLEGDDTFLITYSNAGVPNSASVTNRVYSGGQLNLTRTGTTGYTATKEWLDEEDSVRPTATFTLWRYREGAGFGTAAQVRDSSGRLLTFSISPDSDENRENTYTITFTENGDSVELPKYDQDGYAYVYVVREELTYGASGGDRYEQVFGKVTEDEDGTVTVADTLPEGETRTAGNTFLYNDGTLSNRLTGTVSVSATKTWKAAAYQADFEDVAVELMLQQKPAGDSGDWTTAQRNGAPITAVLYNFYAESMSNTAQSSVPQYDALGRELVYRWVETAVYQDEAIEALSDDASSAEIQAALDQSKKIVVDADGKFELEQAMEGEEKAQTVGYVSETETNGNSTTIENSLTDTIDYRVKKVWNDGNGEINPPADITIQIYQTTNGGQGDLDDPYVSFQINTDGTITVVTNPLPNGVQVEDLEDGAEWDAVVKDLPKYDAEGHLYEYILLEAGGKDNWFPTYDTVRDPETGDYETRVINGPGTGERIFVRKVWVDDGDVLHREPVTFGVYYARNVDEHKAGEKVLDSNSKPVTLTLQDGVWHDFIGLPEGVKAEDVYVVETTMGDAEVKYNKANSTIPTEDELLAGFVKVEGEEKIFEAATQNHRYQVTYEKESTPETFNAHSAYTITNRRLGVINLKVQKTWLDGESGVVEQISKELEKINERGTRLALVFKLQFADKQNGWEITYTGIDNTADTVLVGGEKVHILDKNDQQTSSEQSIIGIDKEGQVRVNDAAAFYNLPKYDSTGGVVQYTVEEVWIDMSGNQSTELTEDDIARNYPDLYAIWKEYRSRSEVSYDLEGDQHDQDHQTMEVTNYRTAVKDVVWYKEWKDDFTANQSLRPDIYLDIYRVVHKPNPDYEAGNPDTEQYIEQIELVLENYKWSDNDNEDGQDVDEQAGSNSWIVTLSDMEKYDAYGFEIQYYAVERTLVHASDYDYQAAQYSIMESGTEVQLGNRDTPSGNAGDYVLDLDVDNWANPDDQPDNIGPFDGSGDSGNTYPQYALVEEGIFTNALSGDYTINGKKLWGNLPSGYSDADLPAVTFEVYDADADPGAKAVATLEISKEQWPQLKDGSSYNFIIEYVGKNTLSVEDGVLVCKGETDDAERLPRYDDAGRQISYVVKESIKLDDDAGSEEIFRVEGKAANFTFTNTYSSPKGELRVKKLLQMPSDIGDKTGGFPSVTFTLKRSYTGNDGETVQDTRFSRSLTWTSAEVESAYNSASLPGANPLSWTGAFEGLDIYAPNGSKYVYEVTETTLNGYTTYAALGDFNAADKVIAAGEGYTVGNLSALEENPSGTSAVQATFYNVYTDEEKISLTGTKQWNDYNDAMGLRPELPQSEVNSDTDNVLGLTVERYVDKDKAVELKLGVDYKITYEKNPSNANQWTFTIEGVEPAKELQKYSTSGKAWTYVVTEKEIPNYVMGSGGTWRKTVSGAGTEMMLTPTPLTNTLYTNTSFTKAWQDEDGTPIAEDYLGFDLTVTFKLQVKPDSGTWQDASTYFTPNGCGLEELVLTSIKNAIRTTGFTKNPDDPFKATLTGRIDSSVWGGTNRFNNLPTVIQLTSGDTVKLTYRVVEESVAYGRQSQTIAVGNDGYRVVDKGLVDSAKLEGNKTTNTISTTSLTVEKVWEDSDNIYDTRPGGDNVMTWESWFVVQRSTDKANWENVEIVRLYGHNTVQVSDHWSETISGLPVSDYSGTTSTPYTYRVRELQPKDGGYTLDEDLSESIIEEDDKLLSGSGDYSVGYTEDSTTSKFTVTNTLDTRKASISAEKVWEPSEPANASVTMVLRRKIGDGQWQDVAGQSKTLKGSNWTAEWNGLPATINGQTVSYDVEERNVQPDSYILTERTEKDGTITFVNTQSKSFTVEKLWVGEKPAEGTTVQVALYRTTDKNLVGSVWGEAVPQDELKPDGEKRTVTLNSENKWSAVFAKLPVEDKDGNAYTYYALELGSDGKPIAEDGRFALNGKDYRVDYEHETDKTTIRNTPSASISGTKTWKDNGNAYETRPDTLQLTLERTTDPNAEQPQWKTVPIGTDGVTFCWTESGEKSDVWRGTFDNLPLYAPDGSAYTYRVREEAILHYEPDDASRDGALVKNNAFAIENTLVGSVNIQGTKTWEGEIGKQPELTLERRPAGSSEEWMPVANAEPVWSDTGKTTWRFTYTNMDKYDEQGVLLEYRVRETVPDGYDVFYTDGTAEDTDAPDGAEETTVAGLQITNVRRVALSVEKFWNGETPAKDAAVQVGLYRTTDPEMVGSAEGEAVTEEAQGTDGANRTAELNAENDWKATFAELPKYDAAHALYYYYALELNAEGKPVENDGKITYGESDHRVSYVFEDGVTEITNRQIAALSGTKTWVDGSDEARPDTLELTLRRTTEPDAENPVWETVDLEAENITLTWTDTDTDVWTYTYTDLPLNAPNGDAYTYAVAERVPDGWDVYYADTVPVDEAPALDKAEEAGDAESGEDAEAASVPARDRYLTNVRRGNLTVEKTVDGAYGDHEQAFAFSAVFRLPEDFTDEADGVYGTYTTAGSDEAEPIEFTDSTAEVTFTLRDGERIEFAGLPGGTDYRIAETNAYGHLSTSTGETGEVPAGTTAAAAFVNTREDDPFAGLRVLKTVSGTDGETGRAFHFTVTLADDSVNGTYGDMEFVNGAAQFTLRDGEVRTATGLPAGIGYTVTEEEANQDGYTTTVTGNTGTLEAGVTAQAAFDNARDKKAEPTPTAAPTPTAEPTPTPKPEESDAVQTGDETDLSVPSMLFLMSVSGLTAAVVVRRRRRRAQGASRK